jgi:tRNA threonylcarbamoyl adenosine modification protein YeaZ
MIILGIDTATSCASLAVGDEYGNLLAGLVFEHQRSLSQKLYGALNDVLSLAEVSFEQIDALAVGIGPGSFTGVRVGVTTMRTLAQVSEKMLVSIGTLELFADHASDATHSKLAIVLPSRKQEVYFQLFENCAAVTKPRVVSHDELFRELSSDSNILLSGQLGDLPAEFARFESFPQTAVSPGSLARLVGQRVSRRTFENPLSLCPDYSALPATSQHKGR